MRKKGIIILLVIIMIFAVIAYFTRDHRIEKLLENIAQSVAGAKVEIDNFHFSFMGMECSWDRLQVADKNNPWKNVIETGKASFVIETRPLFWRRLIIKEMVLENVRSGTQRATSGELPRKKVIRQKPEKPGIAKRASSAFKDQLNNLPVFDMASLGKELKIDSLVNVENLATVRGYERLSIVADSSFKYWDSALKTETYLQRAQKIETQIKAIKVDEIKTISALTSALQKLDKLYKEINSLKKEVLSKHLGLTQTFTSLQQELNALQNNLQKDINRAQQLARLKELNVKDVSLLLFGAPLVNNVEKVLRYIALGRKYLPTAKKLAETKKETRPPRFKGQDIRFPFHHRYPRFLLRHARFSAATSAGDTSRAYFVNGELTGLTNEPVVLGNPTRFHLGLTKIDGNTYAADGSLDHTAEIARDSLWLSAKDFALGLVELGESKYFPRSMNVKKGSFSLTGFFIGEALDLKLEVVASPVEFNFGNDARDKISRIIQDVLSGLDKLTLTAKLAGDSVNYKMQMNSNVDKVLASQLKRILDKNLKQAQQQVEAYVRKEADKRRRKVEELIDKNRKTIYSQLDKAMQKVQQEADELEKIKKDIADRIEKEKNKLGKDTKRKIQNLFKKP